MSFAFKKFNFFTQQELKDHTFPANATCHCVGNGLVFLGCDNGSLHVLDDQYQTVSSFTAHGHRVLFVRWLQVRNQLLTVGVEEPGISTASLKIWEYGKLVGATNPTPLKISKVFNAKYPESEVTALAVKERDISQTLTVAVGLGSGSVYLFHGDIYSSRATTRFHHTSKLMARPDQGEQWCVMGMEFMDEDNLFVVTESQTLTFNIQSGNKTILDQAGVTTSQCCTVKDKLLTVGRNDALYEYTVETRAGCTVFEGKKQYLGHLRRYLVVATQETSAMGVSTTTLSILDVRNKLVAGSHPLQNVQHVICAFDVVAVYLGSGQLMTFHETGMSMQLEVLFKRSLYKLALDLALAHKADEATLANIRQRWGDHLYLKGEYDAAMAQYQHTLGHLEPSYIIRRFLDAQRIHNLTTYLELLHEKGMAAADHTTLLLNCYTKLKDVEKLDAFIHRDQDEMSSESSSQVPKFDMETAFRVLRMAGYYTHAQWVAEKARQPEWMLDVLLEDTHSYAEALAFLDTLPRAQIAEALKRYGTQLINARPEDMTRLLMDLCSPGQDMDGSSYAASVSDFAQLFTDRPTALMLLCEFILNTQQSPPQDQLLHHTLLELYLIPHLMDQPKEGEEFHNREARAGAPARDLQPQTRRAKALELLQQGWPSSGSTPRYNPEHSLMLCRIYHFKEGLVFLYDRLRLYKEVMQVYKDEKDYEALIEACIKYGDSSRGGDPQLWADALDFFCSQEEEDCTNEIMEVVDHIEEGNILPPLVVLQTLARNPKLKVGVVKEYVARQLRRENQEVQKDREMIAKLESETQQMKSELHKLKAKARVFQNSRCSLSGQPLELPVVHFLCGHSFNLRSLGENDHECPLCAPDFHRVMEIMNNMRAGAMQQDRFFTELKETSDGFGVVSEHFGRGLMNMTISNLGPS